MRNTSAGKVRFSFSGFRRARHCLALGVLAGLWIAFVPSVVWASVQINEVFFDPEGADIGAEWIELFNPAAGPVDLSGWQLYPDGIGYFLFPSGFVAGPGQFITVHLRLSGVNSGRDLYHSDPSSNMGNTSGSAALFSSEKRGAESIKSFVQWGRGGETWESAASDAALWEKGTFIPTASRGEGSSIALASDGDSSKKVSSWIITSLPTQGSANNRSVLSPDEIQSPAAHSSAAPSSPLPSPSPSPSPSLQEPPAPPSSPIAPSLLVPPVSQESHEPDSTISIIPNKDSRNQVIGTGTPLSFPAVSLEKSLPLVFGVGAPPKALSDGERPDIAKSRNNRQSDALPPVGAPERQNEASDSQSLASVGSAGTNSSPFFLFMALGISVAAACGFLGARSFFTDASSQ